MPCGNIQQCRASYWSAVHTDMYFVMAIIWLSRLPFYQAEEGRRSQPERPKLALQPQAKGLKTEGNIKASLKKKETLLQKKLFHINQMLLPSFCRVIPRTWTLTACTRALSPSE